MGGEGVSISRGSRLIPGFLHRNWLPAAGILFSVLLVAFWNFRHTEQHIVRRAFSFGNVNDFSWRNRVAAYEASLQMMADKPWLGFGWNQTQRVYDQLYRDPQVAEAAAIQLNDYFTLGTTLGVPALACFVAYVGLSLTRSRECGVRSGDRKAEDKSQQSEGTGSVSALRPLNSGRWLPAVCRAGAIVLLVGFWFDGGLFKLATGSVFWVLLELGRSE